MNLFSRKLRNITLQIGILALITSTTALQALGSQSCTEIHPLEEELERMPAPFMPVFIPFDWSAQSTYIIQGVGCNYISNIGSTGCVPATFVIDPPNKRILLVLGNQKQYILENESFITNVIPGCTRVLKPDGTNFTFDDQVAGYLNVLSMPNSTTHKSHYFGLASDVASCQDKIAIELYLKNGYFSQFNFAQMFPIGTECSYVTGYIEFDHNSIDTTSPVDSYFVLDAECTGEAPSFCSLLFYPGNPCSNCDNP